MFKSMTFKVVIASLAASLLLASVASAQRAADAAEPADIFGDVVDVRVVNIEAVVTRGGERVRDLGPEDFVLRVDGREVPIEYFSEVTGGVADATPGQPRGTVPALEPGKRVGTSYLVFIDDFFSVRYERNRVLQGLIEQLPNLSEGDRMAIVAYNGRGVDMLSNWSESQRDLSRAIERAKDRRTYGLLRRGEERDFEAAQLLEEFAVSGLELALDADRLPQTTRVQQADYASRLASQVERAVRAATATLRSFANPPGRKVMLLMSGGWPNDPAAFVTLDPIGAVEFRRIPRGGELLGPLTSTANRLSYTIYPIDVPGVSTTEGDASSAFPTGFVEAGDGEGTDLSIGFLNQRETEVESSLHAIAAKTGGQPVLDGAIGSAFERVVADTRSYYWLGFTPDWKGDDKEHKIKVDVRGKGMKLRTRKDFSDLSRSTEVTYQVESTLLFGNAPGALPLVAQVAPAGKIKRGKRDVPLAVKIPLDQLTFIPTGKGYQAKIELRIAVQDDRGETADIPVITLPVTLEKMPQDGQFTVYKTEVRIRKPAHDFVVSLYDEASGKIMTTRLEVPAG